MRIGVIGINHKMADLKLRESFAIICQQRFGSSQSTHGHHTFVLLTTCNRTEVYFSSSVLAETHSYIINILRRDLDNIEETFDQKLYSYFGHDCFNHLCRVTSGLDSAIVAETEIQGQVKNAYESAMQYLCLPRDVHFVFQKALKIGKKIRTELPLGRGVPDLEHAVLNAGFHIFVEPEKTKVLFVGSSEINRKVLSFMKGKNFHDLTICNRSHEPARAVSEKYRIPILEWSNISQWVDFDWIIFGTKSPKHLISKEDFAGRSIDHKLIIDLSVPRNVKPSLSKDANITLLNIDQINQTLKIRRKRMTHLLSHAEDIVHNATQRQIDLFNEREIKRRQILATG
ncbi:MAG: Glutamyl-tRNA reductase [Chlamydiae bacterium]|nr:Glutamyl-tRNA reductase [Chlamydiota bacterium]